jgi:membrane protease YdiL (CAAX protease family)
MKRPLLLFVVLAYAISWAAWLPLVLATRGILSSQPSRYLHLLGSLGPAIAAIVTARIHGRQAGLTSLLRRIVAWRVSPAWYLVAWASPFALFFLSLGITRIAGTSSWNPETFGRSAEYPDLSIATSWAASIVFYGFGEEIGWRGYALPYLQRSAGALKATALLSLIWAGWHLPLFWFAPGMSRMGWAGALGWYFSILTGAVLFTWLINSAGSVLIAAIFHGTMDIVFISPGTPLLTNVLGALVTVWGVAVVVVAGPAYLSRKRRKLLIDETGRIAESSAPVAGTALAETRQHDR